MNKNKDKLMSIDQRLKSKTLSRSQRCALMEERRREKYRLDMRKPISIKGVAVCELFLGLMMFASGVVASATQGTARKSKFNAGDVFFIMFIVIILVIIVIFANRKKEPADELCTQLMYKAANFAAAASFAVLFLAGVFIHYMENLFYPETMTFSYEQFSNLTVSLIGFYLAVKNAAYLWLDRTPASDDEEV